MRGGFFSVFYIDVNVRVLNSHPSIWHTCERPKMGPPLPQPPPLQGVCIFEHTCALCTVGSYASLSVHLSVCPSVTGPKFRLENNSYLRKYLQALTSHLPVTPMMVYGTGRWAHINVKLLHLGLACGENLFVQYWPELDTQIKYSTHVDVGEKGVTIHWNYI